MLCHCRIESWCCTWRLTFIFAIFIPLLQMCCFFLHSFACTPHHLSSLESLTNTAFRPFKVQPEYLLIFLNSYFNHATPYHSLFKITPFNIFHWLHTFSWVTGCDQHRGPVNSFHLCWLVILPDHPLSSYPLLYLVYVISHRGTFLLQHSPQKIYY